MLHCCGSSPHEKQENAASIKPTVPSLFLVGPTTIKHFFLLNQTVLCVAVGEPHPQPRYQKGTKSLYIHLYLDN